MCLKIQEIMIPAVFLMIVASCMQLASALPGPIEGFIYLGPVPSSSNTRATRASNYFISRGTANWTNAFADCGRQGGMLATPLNVGEDAALRGYTVSNNIQAAFWIGGRKLSTVWRWETKNQVMGGWDNFESDDCWSSSGCLLAENSCGENWGWCGATCESLNRYVCEF